VGVECDRSTSESAQNVPGKAVISQDAALERLVTRMGQGDREALAQFLKSYGPLIRRRVRGKLRASMRRLFDSQDILSTLSRRLDAYVRDRKFVAKSEDEFWSMIFKVAHNSVAEKGRTVEALRRKEGEESGFASFVLARLGAEESARETSNAHGLELEDILDLLPDDRDKTITRMWATGWNHVQIAAHLGLNDTVVRQRWHRIREGLRLTLAEAAA